MADQAMSRVLVVDDTEGNRYVVSRLLRNAGYEVIEAGDGAGALTQIGAAHPDLVVLDINLPDMSGFDVVQRLHDIPDAAATPILHLSASFTSSADRARGLEQGAAAYLTHPIDPPVFIATVKSLLRAGAADRRLMAAAREWQATFDALSDAVFLLDEHAIVRQANRCARDVFGEAEVIGESLGDLLARHFGAGHGQLVDRLLEGQSMEKELFQLGTTSYLVTTELLEDESDSTRFVCVFEDVTDRFAADRERTELLHAAEEARNDAESANRAKSDFLAMMSHELRTPLNAIGGYAQLIELGIRGPVTDAQKADLDRIKRSQRYLLSLINDVLNFAKIESGHLEVDLSEIAIGEFVNGMRDFVEPQLKERGLSFEREVCGPDVHVRADPEKVQQILINLLSNALKFTPAGGLIRLTCEAKDQSVFISVTDNGKGIAVDKLDSIFEPFIQVDRRFKREQEGIGLGLAISRELARAMGGDLTVESSEGGGSAFSLRLQRFGN